MGLPREHRQTLLVSKDSIRKKIDEAKEDAERLLKSGDLTGETAAVIKSMLLIIDVVVAVLLVKKPRRNSSNSGLPPSQNNGSNGNRNTENGASDKVGKGKVANTLHENSSEVVSPEFCKDCDADLRDAPVQKTEERQKIDIIYKITIHTVRSESKTCPCCGKMNKGKFPKEMSGKRQYGIGIKASIINFLCAQMISLERVQEHFRGLLGCLISQAVMLKYIAQFSISLKT